MLSHQIVWLKLHNIFISPVSLSLCCCCWLYPPIPFFFFVLFLILSEWLTVTMCQVLINHRPYNESLLLCASVFWVCASDCGRMHAYIHVYIHVCRGAELWLQPGIEWVTFGHWVLSLMEWNHLTEKPFNTIRRFGICDKVLWNLMGN